MALWKIIALSAVLSVLNTQCMATARWWQDYFRDLEDAESSDIDRWWDQFRWWDSTEDDMEWDALVDARELSG